ncbi:MAG: cell division protein ZapE [bacterium]|nr:cell division protein ZapE [bacterium]
MEKFTPLGDSVKKFLANMPSFDKLPEDDPDSRCPLCDGYGHIIDEKGARPCECVRNEIAQGSINDARVPQRYTHETLESFQIETSKMRALLEVARQYVDGYSASNTRGLYIYGPTGVGKTHIAIGIMKALMEKGFSGVFYNIADLLDAIRATYDPKMDSDSKPVIEEQLQRQILVLDDFGVQKTSTWVADRLYALINRRYQDCRTLIITSQMAEHDLRMRVDPALSSRIISMCKVIEVRGDDFRTRSHESRRPGKFSK